MAKNYGSLLEWDPSPNNRSFKEFYGCAAGNWDFRAKENQRASERLFVSLSPFIAHSFIYSRIHDLCICIKLGQSDPGETIYPLNLVVLFHRPFSFLQPLHNPVATLKEP